MALADVNITNVGVELRVMDDGRHECPRFLHTLAGSSAGRIRLPIEARARKLSHFEPGKSQILPKQTQVEGKFGSFAKTFHLARILNKSPFHDDLSSHYPIPDRGNPGDVGHLMSYQSRESRGRS